MKSVLSRLFLLLIVALCCMPSAVAQLLDPRGNAGYRPGKMAIPYILPAGADTTVWLVTAWPGKEVYQLEGHTALAVAIKGKGELAYNFGVFDFSSPGFVGRFVAGETDYMAVEWPLSAFINEYKQEGRRMVARELNLTPAQKAAVVSNLQQNVLPQNCTYRYNYVKDNCATRPLAAIERVLPDSIVFAPAPFEAQSLLRPTFRNVMRLYHSRYPWYQFGIDLALGSGIDYPLQRREIAFAPVELDAMLANARCNGVPVVRRTAVLVDAAPDAAVLPATPWWATPDFVCSVFFLITVVVTVRDIRRRKVCRPFDAAFYGIMGLAGCVLTYLIFVSVHEATSPNYLYLWLNPLCLLVPLLIWLKKCKKVLICYHCVNFAVLLVLLGAWYFLPQSTNSAFLPLISADILRSASYVAVKRKDANQ